MSDKRIKYETTYPADLVKKESLTPFELNQLVCFTVNGHFGNGLERKFRLGAWYEFVQGAINMMLL